MDLIKKFFNWVVYSSADSNKISLSIKGIGGIAVTIIMTLVGLTTYKYAGLNTDLNTILDTIVMIVQAIIGVLSGFATIYGILRKIYYTIWPTATPTV